MWHDKIIAGIFVNILLNNKAFISNQLYIELLTYLGNQQIDITVYAQQDVKL